MIRCVSWMAAAVLVCGVASSQEKTRTITAGERQLVLPEMSYDYSESRLPGNFTRGSNSRRRGRFGRSRGLDNTPDDNPLTGEGATLGRVLFYDTRLSADGTVSCASCHAQANAFADPRKVSIGVEGRSGTRNAPSLVNARYYSNGRFFWDERAGSLEEQVLMPIEDPVEMGFDLDGLVERLGSLPEYGTLTEDAYGDLEVTSERVSRALAQFVRSLVSHRSRFDEGLAQVGSINESFPNFSDEENLGKSIFLGRGGGRGRVSCASCHMNGGGRRGNGGGGQFGNRAVVFQGRQASNNGLDSVVGEDNGIGGVTERDRDNGRFKSPSLRNVEVTAPYMHDGRFATLEEVVEHYNSGVQPHPNLDRRLSGRGGRGRGRDGFRQRSRARRLNLTDEEKIGLVAFLKTLTDEQFLLDPRFSDPFR